MMKTRIREYREKNHMSESDLAKKMSIHPSKVSAWEMELDIPSLDQALSMCNVFHITLDELLGRDLEKVDITHLDENKKKIVYEVYDSFITMNDKLSKGVKK